MKKRIMDLKEQEIFNELYNKLNNKTFEESDIYRLFILLREYGKNKGLISEIGSLIAHRKRESGVLQKSIVEIAVNSYNFKERGISLPSLTKNAPFEAAKFETELNDLMINFNKQPLPESTINEILLFAFSIMQFSTYQWKIKEEINIKQNKKIPVSDIDKANQNTTRKATVNIIITTNPLSITLGAYEGNLFLYALTQVKNNNYFKNDKSFFEKNIREMLSKTRMHPLKIQRNREQNIEIWLDGNIL